jgi:hypothetical protein
MSLGAWQVKAGVHFPPWQFFEQQVSAAGSQVSPSVAQALVPDGAGMAAQRLEVQVPVQHSAPVPQAVPVVLQTVSRQTPPWQLTEQHSPELRQAAPATLQKAVEVQALVVVLQAVEQHSAPVAQLLPVASQLETGTAQSLVEGLQYWSQQSEFTEQATSRFRQTGGVPQTLLGSQ